MRHGALRIVRGTVRVNTLRICGEDARPYVSLGHDALAKVASDWDEERRRVARVRRVVAIAGLVVIILGAFAWTQYDAAVRSHRLAKQNAALAMAARQEAKQTAAYAQEAEQQRKDAEASRDQARRSAQAAEEGRDTARRQLAEVCLFPKYTLDNVDRVVVYEGFENYERALARGKGILFLTAHLGGWELSAFTH